MRLYLSIILIFFLTNLAAQTRVVYSVGAGTNQTFNRSIPSKIGFSGYAGVGLNIGNKNAIRFLPSLLFHINEYRSKLLEDLHLIIVQDLVELQLQASLPFNERIRFKAGFFSGYVVYNDSFTNNREAMITNTSGTNYDFSDQPPEKFQAGIIIGSSFSIKDFKRIMINFQIKQNLIPISQQDYTWLPNGRDTSFLFKKKSKPTIVTLGIIYTFSDHYL